ncbi:hypothetical protein XBLMG947_3789 [Xanthomonas bromi]|uniref:Uncharacterized protein n=1 Tax=Xanthomonas bromi TaxID=56449 RepID=A0A1C3NRF2_9XANT|nr:hypothetical protein XBLMG947_3789 [Xanthomonas bromi]
MGIRLTALVSKGHAREARDCGISTTNATPRKCDGNENISEASSDRRSEHAAEKTQLSSASHTAPKIAIMTK